jgi:hypothetical protein
VRKILILATAAGLAAVPATSVARNGENHGRGAENRNPNAAVHQNAVAGCRDVTPSSARRACVRDAARAERARVKAATKACIKERKDIGAKAFKEKYGRRHSLKTCIRQGLAAPTTTTTSTTTTTTTSTTTTTPTTTTTTTAS